MPALAATYQWDAEHRLISVTSGNQNTEFTYDGLGRCVGIRSLVNGAEVSNRRFVWCDYEICEQRTPSGLVSKRFFLQGMKVESGATAGAYFYSHDHLGSIRELTDSGGNVRARYSYDPFGQRTRLIGDLDTDFGFAGMFWLVDSEISMTQFRVYDPSIGRWLSRDPLKNAETLIGPNPYAYVNNNPINWVDPSGTGPFDFFGCLLKGRTLGQCFDDEKKRFRHGPLGDDPNNGPDQPDPSSPPPLDPYRKPDPPPPLDPGKCAGVKPFMAKLNCCIYELDIPSGEVCLTPELNEKLNKCLRQ